MFRRRFKKYRRSFRRGFKRFRRSFRRRGSTGRRRRVFRPKIGYRM